MFSLFNFLSIFSVGSTDPICPYVRTPMYVGPSYKIGPPRAESHQRSRIPEACFTVTFKKCLK